MKYLFILMLSGLLSGGAPVFAAQKISVVASIAPLADFARQVGGDRVEVHLLLPPGASPHSFEPSPRMMAEFARARIFIKIGAGLEYWADRFITATSKGVETVDCSEGIDLLNDDDRHGGGPDPHFWLDPVLCLRIIEKISRVYAAADPAGAAYYQKNAVQYSERLRALDIELREKIGTFGTKKYVTFHNAWNYFSRRYGLQIVGVIEEGPGREPSPRHIDRVLSELRRLKTKVIFAEPQFSPRIADAIAREAGGRVLFLDPIGGRGEKKTYVDMMRHNLAVMEGAMK